MAGGVPERYATAQQCEVRVDMPVRTEEGMHDMVAEVISEGETIWRLIDRPIMP